MASRDPVAIATATRLIESALERRVFPAAVAEVGDEAGVLWSGAFGTLTFESDVAATTSSIFDLASLTKPIATTSVILQLGADHLLSLQERLARCIPAWSGDDRDGATVQDLLEHASGLPARLVDAPHSTRVEFEHDICTLPLEHPLRSRALYSDLGFLLLGFLAADRGMSSLDHLFRRVRERLVTAVPGPGATDFLSYTIPQAARQNVAPTDPLPDDARCSRRLIGEVHDNYAAALGGIAGHAGLFGTVGAVGHFARMLLLGARGNLSVPTPLSPALVSTATTRSGVPGSSRALGWDTMLATSSCGREMSSAAFGHVGFTGTSVWIDPVRDRYFVLLTNRVCGGGTSDDMQAIRRAFHNALASL